MIPRLSILSKAPILIWIGFIVLPIVFSSCKFEKSEKVTDQALEVIETGIYLKEQLESEYGVLNYRILYPNGFDRSQKYPVFLFLHGSGERGEDNEAQLVHGSEMIRKGMDVHKSIAIFPQCPTEDYWVRLKETESRPDGLRIFEPNVDSIPSNALSMVMELMDKIYEEDYVDKSRIFVGGLSMGGMGTFDLCWRKRKMIAAAIAICGAGSASKAADIADLPIRIYHGLEDDVVPLEESLKMVEALKEAGGNPEVFFYEGVNHNSWDNAFAEPDFLTWLYQQKRSF